MVSGAVGQGRALLVWFHYRLSPDADSVFDLIWLGSTRCPRSTRHGPRKVNRGAVTLSSSDLSKPMPNQLAAVFCGQVENEEEGK